MGTVHEYVPLKEFAQRMNIPIRTARDWVHKERIKAYTRRLNTAKSIIFINWTLFQRDFEKGKI